MKEIKCGIIGSGVIAPVHLESYRQVPGVTVKTLCDLIPEKAEALAKKSSDISMGRYSSPRSGEKPAAALPIISGKNTSSAQLQLPPRRE